MTGAGAADAAGCDLLVRFDEPVRTVAPGQSCVIYDGLACLGGGIITGPVALPSRF